ncbi:uncharacterized protein LOC100740170 [Bombus impatiens]|uniref:Uncharacterized protein LOC100740170 n=1 Tax=Bombus impatiens TaxID=132113 RepID=A0A6P8LLH7_BOMIM|nr:uncharacterized protein LOC100740170 [Bombus impatiens]
MSTANCQPIALITSSKARTTSLKRAACCHALFGCFRFSSAIFDETLIVLRFRETARCVSPKKHQFDIMSIRFILTLSIYLAEADMPTIRLEGKLRIRKLSNAFPRINTLAENKRECMFIFVQKREGKEERIRHKRLSVN